VIYLKWKIQLCENKISIKKEMAFYTKKVNQSHYKPGQVLRVPGG
jgi:hypothetical protein